MNPIEKLAGLLGKTVEAMGEMTEAFANSMIEAVEAAKGAGAAVTLSTELAEALKNAKAGKEEGKDIFTGQVIVNSEGQVSLLNHSDQRNVVINSRTVGKFTTEFIGGKEHIVVNMMPIKGDTVMNEILYSLEDVKNTFTQFADLPVPVGHPVIEGKPIDASHTLAQNAFGVGAFIRKPRMSKAKVLAQIVVGVDEAEKTERGRNIVNDIKSGKSIGVSTAGHARISNQTGTAVGDGKRYSLKAEKIIWNHVAMLPGEEAAGKHAGTQVLNAELGRSAYTYICNVDETQLEDDESMTIDEQIANVQKAGHIVLLKDAPELEKLKITNAQLDAVTALEAEKETVLNSTKAELVATTKQELSAFDGMTQAQLDTMKSLANASPTDYSPAGGGTGDDQNEGEATAESVQNEFDKITYPEEEEGK